MPAQDSFDVVIIGAGVAGALTAAVLAEKGVQVLLLEAGETGDKLEDLVLRWAGATTKGLGAPYIASQPDKIPGPEQPPNAPDLRQPRDRDSYYDQKGAEPYQSTY